MFSRNKEERLKLRNLKPRPRVTVVRGEKPQRQGAGRDSGDAPPLAAIPLPEFLEAFSDPSKGVPRSSATSFVARTSATSSASSLAGEVLFKGKDAISWVLQETTTTRTNAEAIAQALLDEGIIVSSNEEERFLDSDDSYYRLLHLSELTEEQRAIELVLSPERRWEVRSNLHPSEEEFVASEELNATHSAVVSGGKGHAASLEAGAAALKKHFVKATTRQPKEMTFLIHGWNDNLAQWRNVQRNLQEEWGHPVHLFTYESLDDMATIQLLARRFHAFVQEHTDTTGLKKRRERLERERRKREKEQREKELKEQRWQEKQRKKKQRAIDPDSLEISNPTNFTRVHRYDLASLSSDRQLQTKDATKQKIVSSDNETLLQIIASHGLDLKEWKALLHKLAAYEGLPFKTILEQSLAIEDFLLQKRAMLNEQATRLREKKDKLIKAGRERKDMLVEASRERRDRLMQSGREKKERILEVSREKRARFVEASKEKRERWAQSKEKMMERGKKKAEVMGNWANSRKTAVTKGEESHAATETTRTLGEGDDSPSTAGFYEYMKKGAERLRTTSAPQFASTPSDSLEDSLPISTQSPLSSPPLPAPSPSSSSENKDEAEAEAEAEQKERETTFASVTEQQIQAMNNSKATISHSLLKTTEDALSGLMLWQGEGHEEGHARNEQNEKNNALAIEKEAQNIAIDNINEDGIKQEQRPLLSFAIQQLRNEVTSQQGTYRRSGSGALYERMRRGTATMLNQRQQTHAQASDVERTPCPQPVLQEGNTLSASTTKVVSDEGFSQARSLVVPSRDGDSSPRNGRGHRRSKSASSSHTQQSTTEFPSARPLKKTSSESRLKKGVITSQSEPPLWHDEAPVGQEQEVECVVNAWVKRQLQDRKERKQRARQMFHGPLHMRRRGTLGFYDQMQRGVQQLQTTHSTQSNPTTGGGDGIGDGYRGSEDGEEASSAPAVPFFEQLKKGVRKLKFSRSDGQEANKDTVEKLSGPKINIVVYSTGALIVRYFLYLYYKPLYRHRIQHLIMLAPANFGSPWAKKGKTGVGKYWVGDKTSLSRLFHCGKKLLTSLECCSPFLWRQAQRDVMLPEEEQYLQPYEIKVTIYQGGKPYPSGWKSQLTRGDMFGTDGTVTVCGSALSVRQAELHLSSPSEPTVVRRSTADVAFRLLEFDHRTIIDSLEQKSKVLDLLKEARKAKSVALFHQFKQKQEMENLALSRKGFSHAKLIVFRFELASEGQMRLGFDSESEDDEEEEGLWEGYYDEGGVPTKEEEWAQTLRRMNREINKMKLKYLLDHGEDGSSPSSRTKPDQTFKLPMLRFEVLFMDKVASDDSGGSSSVGNAAGGESYPPLSEEERKANESLVREEMEKELERRKDEGSNSEDDSHVRQPSGPQSSLHNHVPKFGQPVNVSMTPLRNKTLVSPLLEAMGKFQYHSISKRQCYLLVDPTAIRVEMEVLSKQFLNGRPVVLAACLKGRASSARVISCSLWEDVFKEHKVQAFQMEGPTYPSEDDMVQPTHFRNGPYQTLLLSVICSQEDWVIDVAREVRYHLIEMEKNRVHLSSSVSNILSLPSNEEHVSTILKLLQHDEDIDETIQEFSKEELCLLFRFFCLNGSLRQLLHVICVTKGPELSAPTRKRIISEMLCATYWLRKFCKGEEREPFLCQEVVSYLLCSTNGEQLTALKNELDRGGGKQLLKAQPSKEEDDECPLAAVDEDEGGLQQPTTEHKPLKQELVEMEKKLMAEDKGYAACRVQHAHFNLHRILFDFLEAVEKEIPVTNRLKQGLFLFKTEDKRLKACLDKHGTINFTGLVLDHILEEGIKAAQLAERKKEELLRKEQQAKEEAVTKQQGNLVQEEDRGKGHQRHNGNQTTVTSDQKETATSSPNIIAGRVKILCGMYDVIMSPAYPLQPSTQSYLSWDEVGGFPPQTPYPGALQLLKELAHDNKEALVFLTDGKEAIDTKLRAREQEERFKAQELSPRQRPREPTMSPQSAARLRRGAVLFKGKPPLTIANHSSSELVEMTHCILNDLGLPSRTLLQLTDYNIDANISKSLNQSSSIPTRPAAATDAYGLIPHSISTSSSLVKTHRAAAWSPSVPRKQLPPPTSPQAEVIADPVEEAPNARVELMEKGLRYQQKLKQYMLLYPEYQFVLVTGTRSPITLNGLNLVNQHSNSSSTVEETKRFLSSVSSVMGNVHAFVKMPLSSNELLVGDEEGTRQALSLSASPISPRSLTDEEQGGGGGQQQAKERLWHYLRHHPARARTNQREEQAERELMEAKEDLRQKGDASSVTMDACHLFRTFVGAATAAYQAKLLNEKSLVAVAEAAVKDLAATPFWPSDIRPQQQSLAEEHEQSHRRRRRHRNKEKKDKEKLEAAAMDIPATTTTAEGEEWRSARSCAVRMWRDLQEDIEAAREVLRQHSLQKQAQQQQRKGGSEGGGGVGGKDLVPASLQAVKVLWKTRASTAQEDDEVTNAFMRYDQVLSSLIASCIKHQLPYLLPEQSAAKAFLKNALARFLPSRSNHPSQNEEEDYIDEYEETTTGQERDDIDAYSNEEEEEDGVKEAEPEEEELDDSEGQQQENASEDEEEQQGEESPNVQDGVEDEEEEVWLTM